MRKQCAWLHLATLPAFALLTWAGLKLLPLVAALVWAGTVGRRELARFAGPAGGWGRTFAWVPVVLVVQLAGARLAMLTSGNADPQAVALTRLTAPEYVQAMAALPLVAASEEALKALWGLALLALLPLRGLKRLAAASVAVAFLFGALHAIGWPVSAVWPVAVSSLLDLVLLVGTGSVWPLVGAHLLQDGLHFTARYAPPGVLEQVLVLLQVWLVGAAFVLSVRQAPAVSQAGAPGASRNDAPRQRFTYELLSDVHA
jgi:hypothetical protein